MKIKIAAKDLQKRLDILSKVAKQKTTLPILDCFKFEVTDDLVTLTASDLEVTVVTRVQPNEVKETGSVCIPADKFTDIIKDFKDCELEISLSSRQYNGSVANDLIIKSKGGKFKIPTMDSEDFPQIQEPNVENQITISSSVLSSGINKSLFASHTDQMFEPVLCGINIDLKTTGTTIVATDKVRMGVVEHDTLSATDQSVALPKKLSGIIPSAFSEGDESIEFSFDNRLVKLNGANYTLYGKLSEGSYPNYRGIINNATNACMTVKTEEFVDAVKRVIKFCSYTSSAIALSSTENKLLISAEDKDFDLSAEEEIDATNQTNEGAFLINGRYLLEIIQKINTPSVEVCYSDTHPIVFFKPVGETKEKYFFVLVKMGNL